MSDYVNLPSKIVVVDFHPDARALDPDLRVKRRSYYSDCHHRRMSIDEATRTVVCRDCSAVLDPIECMIMWASDWERYANSVKWLMHEEQERRNELAVLLRRIRNGRSQLRRLITRGADVKMPHHNDAPSL